MTHNDRIQFIPKWHVLLVILCAFTSSYAAAESEARARATAARVRTADVRTCTGRPVDALVVGQAICLRQQIDTALIQPLPLSDVDVDIQVLVGDVQQPLRGEPVVDAATDSITFTFVPTRDARSGRLSVETSVQPSSDPRVSAGYYDVIWYELSVVWPTFFSYREVDVAPSTEEEEEEEEEEEVKAEVEFNPFPCTWFLGADYLCNSTTWISG